VSEDAPPLFSSSRWQFRCLHVVPIRPWSAPRSHPPSAIPSCSLSSPIGPGSELHCAPPHELCLPSWFFGVFLCFLMLFSRWRYCPLFFGDDVWNALTLTGWNNCFYFLKVPPETPFERQPASYSEGDAAASLGLTWFPPIQLRSVVVLLARPHTLSLLGLVFFAPFFFIPVIAIFSFSFSIRERDKSKQDTSVHGFFGLCRFPPPSFNTPFLSLCGNRRHRPIVAPPGTPACLLSKDGSPDGTPRMTPLPPALVRGVFSPENNTAFEVCQIEIHHPSGELPRFKEPSR